MALTTLDPNTALIVVDLQKGLVGVPFIHPIDKVVERSRALLHAFRERGLPVVLVNVAGGAPGRTERPRRSEEFPAGWTDLIAELDQRPDDIVVTKRTWCAFVGTNLEDRLKALGANYIQAGRWRGFAVRDGNLVTGQQNFSGEETARAVVEALGG